ncbi:hypothetical protein ACGFZP_23925 [Kitasatospora sp. NPDC048239]|uniref:hypothetical protein n=1 Tax=Kitasatospora sp. NPDC048239 TaxID=3364046 RepID=UPI0037229FF5
MTVILRRTYTLAAWPWREMPWVRVPEGLEFTLYDTTSLGVRGTTVPGTPEEEVRWAAAHRAFQEALGQAESDVRHAHGVRSRSGFMVDRRAVRLRRYGLTPGRRARSRRLFAECEARMRAAEEVYRPVREEIEARLAEAAARLGEAG